MVHYEQTVRLRLHALTPLAQAALYNNPQSAEELDALFPPGRALHLHLTVCSYCTV